MKKMKKKGQALVEFVLILPVFLIIIVTVIELGSINYQKLKLESDLQTVVNMYLKGDDFNSYANNNNLRVNVKTDEGRITIELKKDVKIITPVLKLINGSLEELKAERVFYDE